LLSYPFRDTPGIPYGLAIQYSSEFVEMTDQITAEKVIAAFTRRSARGFEGTSDGLTHSVGETF
jgi:hypothetical protein